MEVHRKFFGRTQRCYPGRGGLVAECEINCLALPPAVVAKAVKQAARKRLDQMCGHGVPAGHILSIGSSGTVVRVAMMITDPAAIQKMRHEIYHGAIAEFDEDDRLFRVSLVDSDHLAKRSDAGIIAKIYEAPERIKKGDRRMAERIARETGRSFKEALGAMRQTEQLKQERIEAVKKLVKTAEREADRVLRTVIRPDSASAQKRAQDFEDWKILYKALRQPLSNDPKFKTWR
jgi:hypothetical protein